MPDISTWPDFINNFTSINVAADAAEVDLQVLHVAKPKYKLADLLAQCNKNAQPTADMVSWECMSPVGAEML